ncbi:S1 RNA-binding domain-containing protein [Palleniella muris]|uniref:S1 RNA-binding domain-containing protein n=1 Tax=Palleniella muris TaxID=3038145 RepID=UPI001440EFBC|nr:S1 RNA-binding domain-containing protein [Palleniella muris]
MTDKLSIDQAYPLHEFSNVIQYISDIQYYHTIVEFKSEENTIVAFPNNDTCLLSALEPEDINGLELGSDIKILYEADGRAVKDNSKLALYLNILPRAKDGQIFKATVVGATKQGLLMSIEGLQCFMPKGQVGRERNGDLQSFVGKSIDVKLISVKLKEEESNRFLPIVSHKILEDENNAIDTQSKLQDLKVGSIVQGIVKSIANYGVFVTLFPSIDGLIHITDLSWERVSNPSDIVSIGQNITVVILDINQTNDGKLKISLGLKQLSRRPWERLDKDTREGNIVSGSICNITDYGIFIKLPSGVQGLVHKSELSWDTKVSSIDFTKGQILSAKIINIDWEKEKLLLSIKQMVADPWKDIENKISIGDIVEATIINITNFGIFVNIADGIEGMIHVSELSWTEKIKKLKEYYTIGDHLDAVIISINKDKRKIELSHKRILPNPWQNYTVGQHVTAIVIGIEKQGIQVKLANDHLPAFIPAKLVPNDFAIGESEILKCQVQEIDENKRIIILAIV